MWTLKYSKSHTINVLFLARRDVACPTPVNVIAFARGLDYARAITVTDFII